MVIQDLAKLCQKKSVIIAIYGLSSLDGEKVREFYDFWSTLVAEVRAKPRSFRSHLVLLLAEKNNPKVLNKLHLFNFLQPPAINANQYSISLTPLDKILQNDIENWLAQDNESFPTPQHKPIIFITSNREKPLPEPFLRRCLYFFVDFPKQERLQQKLS